MRKLSTLVTLVLTLAAGCRGEQGEPGAQGPQGERGEVGPQGPAGAPGRDGKGAREVHLIDSATGEDLGVRTGGLCVWSDALAGELCYTQGIFQTYYFLQPDCNGPAYVRGTFCPAINNQFFVFKNEAVKIDCLSKARLQPVSAWDHNSGCQSATTPDNAFPLFRSGVVFRERQLNDLHVSLQ